MSQQLPFGRGLHGVELGYSAPYDDAPRKNRPDRFLHFVVVARTGTASYGSPEEWEPLGRRAFGRRRGSLFYVPVEGVHYQHYLFMWREGGVEYQASLHSWDDAEGAVELLGALVSGLVPPADLGSSTAP